MGSDRQPGSCYGWIQSKQFIERRSIPRPEGKTASQPVSHFLPCLAHGPGGLLLSSSQRKTSTCSDLIRSARVSKQRSVHPTGAGGCPSLESLIRSNCGYGLAYPHVHAESHVGTRIVVVIDFQPPSAIGQPRCRLRRLVASRATWGSLKVACRCCKAAAPLSSTIPSQGHSGPLTARYLGFSRYRITHHPCSLAELGKKLYCYLCKRPPHPSPMSPSSLDLLYLANGTSGVFQLPKVRAPRNPQDIA